MFALSMIPLVADHVVKTLPAPSCRQCSDTAVSNVLLCAGLERESLSSSNDTAHASAGILRQVCRDRMTLFCCFASVFWLQLPGR